MNRPRHRLIALALAAIGVLAACNDQPLERRGADAGPIPGGLTAEDAARVVAKVGDKQITLGDYAAALERMDQFDRLRYQTKERRRELLGELIDVELLAQEARRRGLDKDPEAVASIRQVLRDAMLAESRVSLPAPAEIPDDEVRAFYDKNADKFREPERRRVAAIVMNDRAEAEKTLKEALKITTPIQWGELFLKASITAPKQRGPSAPTDLAGDLGIVGPPDDPKGANVRVPDPLRSAVFGIANVGAIADHVVEAEGKFFIVRMNGITAGHTRTLKEADRSIRVTILQQKMQDKEDELEARLRQKFPVQIDEASLANVKMPAGLDKLDANSGASPSSYAEAAAMRAADAGVPQASPDGGH